MITKTLVFSLFLLLQVSRSFASRETAVETKSKFVIAGYWPDYRTYINITESASSMTDLILFSIQPSEDGLLKKDMCCLGDDILDKARDAQERYKSLNLLVSVGGAGRSTAFAKISRDERRRNTFLRELKGFCLKEGLDGVDFDWEQPSNRDEYTAYIQLLIEASTILHREGLLITLALHPGQYFPREVYQHIDKIHLMTYDMLVRTDSHHASFTSSFQAVESLIDSGCDSAKIVLGLPAYSRNKKDPSQIKTYSELVDSFVDETGDGQNQGKDPVELDEHHDFALESRTLIRRKIRQLMKKRLAGIFIWEIGQDYRSEDYPSGLLLHHISEAFGAVSREQLDEL